MECETSVDKICDDNANEYGKNCRYKCIVILEENWRLVAAIIHPNCIRMHFLTFTLVMYQHMYMYMAVWA